MVRHQHVQKLHEGIRGLLPIPCTEIGIGLHRTGDPQKPVYPQRIHKDDSTLPLSSLRELLPQLRKIGERGRKVTRFKGLG